MLLFHGANIHHKTLEGRTGLHYACLYLKARVVSVLLQFLFERFSTYRLAHPKAAFDGTRWTRYVNSEFGLVMFRCLEGYYSILLLLCPITTGVLKSLTFYHTL